MRTIKTLAVAAGVSGMLMGATAFADGAALYTQKLCNTCHGADAMGTGAMAEFMTIRVPSLRELSKNNDGVFPMLDALTQILNGSISLGPNRGSNSS